MPDLYIITGSNGAGKSAVGPDYLPESIQQKCIVFDGDKLFMQKQRELWLSGIRAIKEAKKIAFSFVEETFESLVEDAITNKKDFVYEGHFTNDATWDVPRKFKANGFSIHMIFLGLSSTDLSSVRVVARSQEGGHYVDPLTVSANYYGNLEKLNIHFSMFDTLQLLDTSEIDHILIAVFSNGNATFSLPFASLPEWFKMYLPNLIAKIR